MRSKAYLFEINGNSVVLPRLFFVKQAHSDVPGRSDFSRICLCGWYTFKDFQEEGVKDKVAKGLLRGNK